MYSDYSETSGGHERLYDVVATASGVRLSATSERGHTLVIDLMTRLGLFTGERTTVAPNVTWFTESKRDSPTHESVTTPADAGPSIAGATIEVGLLPAVNGRLSSMDPQPGAATPDPAPASPHRLTALAALHISNMNRGALKERSSVRERRYALDLLVQMLGDVSVPDITTEHATQFADQLSAWPAYRHNHPDFKYMSFASIVTRARERDLPPIHRSTQAKHIKALNAFFHWCIESEVIRENPFRFVQLSRYRDVILKKKEPFSPEDLKALFDPERMRQCDAPHKFWVPLISYYTGMRTNEISQLYLDDIKTHHVRDAHGVDRVMLCFEVTPHRHQQRVKSAYSQRTIPVHSALLHLGLADYIEDVRRSGAVHVFPGLSWHGDGPGRATTLWFNGHHLRKDCGIQTPMKTLHCFRHTINTLAERCNIPDSIMRTLNGHSDGEGVRARAYVARGSLLECQAALERLPFPELAVVPYVSGQFAGYLALAKSAEEHEARQRAEGKATVRRKGRRPNIKVT